MLRRKINPGITVWWVDKTYGVLECIVIAISRGYIEVNTARYKSNIPLRPKDLFETEEEALLAALFRLDTDIVLETNSIKQHNENIVELTAKKEGLMKAYQARHQL